MRDQISILHAKGKTVGEVIFSRSEDNVLISLGDDEFAILRARRCYDEDAEIEHDVSDTEFYRHDYRTEDLEKVFSASDMAFFAEEDAKHEAERKKRAEKWERKEFEKLKAKFGG